MPNQPLQYFFMFSNPFLSILFSSPSPRARASNYEDVNYVIMSIMSILKMSIGRQVRRKAAGDRDRKADFTLVISV